MSWALVHSSSQQQVRCPRQAYERNRQRIVAQEDYARSLAQEMKALRTVEYENRTERILQARRHAPPPLPPSAAGACSDPEERLERIAKHKQQAAAAREQEARAWESELARTEETPEKRRARIKAQALALKEKNEAARQAFVQECYDRQWRDACDNARLLDGQAMEAFMAQERLRQIHDRAARHEQFLRDEAALLERVREHERQLEAAEDRKQARRATEQKAIIATLRSQIVAAREARAAAQAREAEEDAKELAAADVKGREELEKEQARKREEKQRAEEMKAANAKRLGLREAAQAEERAQDLCLLQHALALEKASEGAEQAKRETAAAEARAYREYLIEQMNKAAQDEEAIARARAEMEQRVWGQRDAALRRQEEARAALQQQVHADNAQQLRSKALATEEEARLEAAQVERWKEEQARAQREEEAQAAARREAVGTHNAALRRQVEELRARAILEKQREYLSSKHTRKEEAEHAARLKAQAGRLRTFFPLSSGPWTS